MSETAVFILIGSILLFFVALEIYILIVGHKQAANYTPEKAYKEMQDESNDWIGALLVTVLIDVIGWFWLGNRISRPVFIFVLIGVDLLFILLAAIRYDTKSMAKKKVKESEQKGIEQQGEDHRL
jgi:hypothetical protein